MVESILLTTKYFTLNRNKIFEFGDGEKYRGSEIRTFYMDDLKNYHKTGNLTDYLRNITKCTIEIEHVLMLLILIKMEN